MSFVKSLFGSKVVIINAKQMLKPYIVNVSFSLSYVLGEWILQKVKKKKNKKCILGMHGGNN